MIALLAAASVSGWVLPTGGPVGRAAARVTARAAADAGTTELLALSLPGEPSAALGPRDVVLAVCRGLQHVDVPTQHRGIERLFRFATYGCRAALTARRGSSAGNGGEADCAATLESFVQEARVRPSQALFPLLRCRSFAVGEPTLVAATQTRGAIATLVVAIASSDGKAFRYRSGFAKGEQAEGSLYAAATGGDELVRFTLQQERRPPLQDCWLLTEVLPSRLHDMENKFTWA